MANEQQIDNLVSLIDGYVEKDGHHLNVNVLTEKLFWMHMHTLKSILSLL